MTISSSAGEHRGAQAGRGSEAVSSTVYPMTPAISWVEEDEVRLSDNLTASERAKVWYLNLNHCDLSRSGSDVPFLGDPQPTALSMGISLRARPPL